MASGPAAVDSPDRTESQVSLAPNELIAPSWESDEDVKECHGCQKGFKLTRRRHHCRGCGKVFCEACSSKRIELPDSYQLKGKQRVCEHCYARVIQLTVESNPDAHPPKPDYPKVKEELVANLKKLLVDTEESSWEKKADKKSVAIWTKKLEDSALLCVKTHAVVPCPVEKVFDIYNTKDAWKKWQPELVTCRTVEEVDENSEVIYVVYSVPVIDDRDSCVYTTKISGTVLDPSDDKARSLISCSVEHPLCPHVKKKVRAIVSMSSTIFRPITVDGAEHTEIESVIHSDPRGLIPPFLINQFITKAAGQILDMSEYMQSA